MKCIVCDIEPRITKRPRGYLFIKCPKCGFSCGGFYGIKAETEHWERLQVMRPHQMRWKGM